MFSILFIPVKAEITSKVQSRSAVNVVNSSMLSCTYLNWDIYVRFK